MTVLTAKHRGRRTTVVAVLALTATLTLGACGSPAQKAAPTRPGGSNSGPAPVRSSDGKVTVQNCGKDVTFDTPVTKLFAYDPSIISIALAAGARDELVAVAGLGRKGEVLRSKYGSLLDGLNVIDSNSLVLENVIAAKPQVVFAGWGYGFSEAKSLTPDTLKGHNIGTYLLSETCRPEGAKTRGTMNPWQAMETDVTNIGAITGHSTEAEQAVAELRSRREAVTKLNRPDKAPTVFLFDSGNETIFTSGSFGGPQAVIEAAGAKNATEDVKDTWTKISWERLTASNPDVIAFVDYPAQTYEAKLEALRTNPASKDLKAVKEGRFVNLPYAFWTSGPLNVDAAEHLRKALEHYELAPRTDLKPALDLSSVPNLPGNEWLGRR